MSCDKRSIDKRLNRLRSQPGDDQRPCPNDGHVVTLVPAGAEAVLLDQREPQELEPLNCWITIHRNAHSSRPVAPPISDFVPFMLADRKCEVDAALSCSQGKHCE